MGLGEIPVRVYIVGGYVNKLVPDNRILSLLDQVIPDVPLFDLFCDHGLIGLYALRSGLSSQVVFIDKQPHLVSSLQSKCDSVLLPEETKIVSLICADVCSYELRCQEVANFIIAGIGAQLCCRALNNLVEQAVLGSRFICQVNRGMDELPEMVCSRELELEHCYAVELSHRSRRFVTQVFEKKLSPRAT